MVTPPHLQHSKRPCPGGCGVLVVRGYCDACVTKYHAQDAARRGSSTERGYTNRWRKARALYLRAHPMCECERCKGVVMPADTVDHIQAHDGGGSTLFWDTANWRAMHHTCHSRKTVLVDGGFGRERAKPA